MKLYISEWFWKILDESNSSIDDLFETLSDMTREQITRFQLEWDNSALEMMSIYEDFHHDHFNRMEFARWVVSKGKETFDQAFSNRDYSKELYKKYEVDSSSHWNCVSSNTDIDGTPPEYLSQKIFELKFDEELSDIVDDSINDGDFDGFIDKTRKNEKFFEYEYS